jgi:hypothetical protein
MIGGISDGLQSLRYSFIVVAALLFLLTPLGTGIPPEDKLSEVNEDTDDKDRLVISALYQPMADSSVDDA